MTTPTAIPTAIVTGASRGIGAAIAPELARRGYHVIVNYRRDSAAAAGVVAEIRQAGGSATALAADVTDADAVAEMIEAVVADRGRIDALVVNANTAPPPFAPLAELSWPAFAAKVTNELAGAFHITQQAVAAMRSQGAGRLVFLGSTVADYVGGGRLAHGTAKAALATFARHVAAETARDGISVLTVAPGAVRTEATAAVLDPAREKILAENSVLHRVLEPTDVAVAVGLALDLALRPATGSVLRVDAGWSVLVGGPTA
ncbi:SDR family NAD(P)-dependent oxidoreductase [Frankia sp. R82]|uniref:SDR family NAD(P)-dependent oxidoreductase n=1 Tax=Frankia sp. R82 TaxID=2950553 RepID=UPI0020449B0D|nr:SDR family NAD(P)-dependent oxidoreductase [Frankia sp. R82]MCM3882364.1 SDR family oxidoreductase [Frankia sp. R82]